METKTKERFPTLRLEIENHVYIYIYSLSKVTIMTSVTFSLSKVPFTDKYIYGCIVYIFFSNSFSLVTPKVKGCECLPFSFTSRLSHLGFRVDMCGLCQVTIEILCIVCGASQGIDEEKKRKLSSTHVRLEPSTDDSRAGCL